MRQPNKIIINGKTLADIIADHAKWLRNDGGCRANLTDADLTDADLTCANLTCANLSRANLTDADLTYTDLTYTNLSRANLSRANLIRANLTDADLTDADLTDADLTCANLSRANLISEIYQISRIGSNDRMTTYNATKDIVWCGCFKGTIEEFSAQVEKTHADNPKYLAQYRTAIAYFKSLTEIK